MRNAIEIHALTKRYGILTALDEVSFEVGRGELFGLIGPDGAGKTTLFRLLATLVAPDGGTASVDGLDIVADYKRIRERVGYMPGRFSLYPDLSVGENLAFFAALFGVEIAENYDLIAPIYRQIEPFRARRAGKLSGGMKRRVGIAQALLNDPEILILDEPTAGLDPGERVRFRNLLSEFAQERIVLISTHIVSDVEYIAAENAVMKAGKIIAQDTTEGLVKQIEAKVWQGNIPMEQLARWEHRLRVVNLRNEPDGTVTLRYLADAPQLPDSVPAQPRLEDLYLWLFPEEMEEAK